ncbi:16S rRNA (uracil1498-N3)-methyltransferase [Desulfohalotomaculum tongense]|uniref:16S rRNA (uracil(1498)-N(3))-methyltransferase n=1 Tax=Desulforadius tongensis TaxID=1216062 RepID=UPI001958DF00|nr:16S rRNA (uracil(1498)-N(3))-methyltransferase [Desulforadius tongensis]MBM7855712.1 16S rRNA (uracil1498-N3)-methyltransferase [Desulforadius tongensis]
MARFFVDPANITEKQALITGPDVKHIKKVLRLKEGDKIILLDGLGHQYQGKISRLEKDAVWCDNLEQTEATGEPPVHITMVQCLPKADKMELVIQKGTELGVSRFIPLQCRRSVVKLNEEKSAHRQQRWQRVALEAAKQCRRPLVPRVEKPMHWQEVLNEVPEDALLLLPWEDERAVSLPKVLSSACLWKKVYIIIGPEGGFEQQEVELARQYGAKSVSLGPRILRTETAGLALASIIMYLYGDWK